jgi:hypothetical protein
MKRAALTLLAPTVAVCRFGCASCYAAPITVLWLAGIVAIVFGFLGGPVSLTVAGWSAVALGLALWGMASLWTAIAIRGSDEARCDRPDRPVCHTINSDTDESDPRNQIRRTR